MYEGLLFWLVVLGIITFATSEFLWLLTCWYWFWDKHKGANRAKYETTVVARCPCHPNLEGRGQTKIQAIRRLEAAVRLGNATEKAG
jgi:hypothetical protein